ncbi:putative cytochrome c mitochondrial import factor protein [Botrytis fragariae]|uniref:Putative cytochrome c mitochondrial import factor protein n=1 Tax=Botrytis fragariae TaxID=1964551 RepID=A0A8H6AKK8_9HELO|nr:putative cytochrome c mitochondrial import factor protein [Botrytis fragariae]KAF5869046.1 putative cytochrome c mitochondrial import factor protein [Botrytis fragariae]
MTFGKAPPPKGPQHFGVFCPLIIPIPRTEVLYWVKSVKDEKSLRALILITEIVFLGSIILGTVIEFKTTDSNPFDSPRFTKFSIVAEETVSSTSKLLTIKPKKSTKSDPYASYWEKGLWSVEFKQPLLQIARSYTPLPHDENATNSELRFLIRKEPNGEMSNYLFRLQANSEIELRGPHVEFDLPENVSEVVFLAGGTGIAPAMQVAHTLLEVRKPEGKLPRICIVWANRRREDCVGGETYKSGSKSDTLTARSSVVQQLQRMQQKYPENLQVNYVVDEEGTFINQKMISQAIQSSSAVDSGSVIKKSNSKLLFVSGPEGFINYFSGPKRWRNGKQEQGEVGGVLGYMGVKDWKVFKL